MEKSSPPPGATVYINSLGGAVEAAIEIGRTIRSRGLLTNIGIYILDYSKPSDILVPRAFLPGSCISAATLIYLGGRLRFFNRRARFGVHQFSFGNPDPTHLFQSQILSAKIARYVTDMGVDSSFLELSASTPHEKINIIPRATLERMGVITGGQTAVEWTTQSRGGAIYVRGERDSIFGHHKVMLQYSGTVGFTFWAVIEAQGREEELENFGIVEIVLNGEDTRIDISDRCQRVRVNGYINIIAKITNEEASSLAHSASFNVQVRVSKDADMFLGIAAMNTMGGRDQLVSFVKAISVV